MIEIYLDKWLTKHSWNCTSINAFEPDTNLIQLLVKYLMKSFRTPQFPRIKNVAFITGSV